MMWVTVRASQPSVSMPTEMTFWMRSPGFPGWPTVSTCTRSRSACSCLVSLRAGRSSSSSRLVVVRTAADRDRLGVLPRLGLLQHLRVDVQRPVGHRQLVDAHACRWTNAWWTRAAVSMRLATVIITGGVGSPASAQRCAVSSQSLPSR